MNVIWLRKWNKTQQDFYFANSSLNNDILKINIINVLVNDLKATEGVILQ